MNMLFNFLMVLGFSFSANTALSKSLSYPEHVEVIAVFMKKDGINYYKTDYDSRPQQLLRLGQTLVVGKGDVVRLRVRLENQNKYNGYYYPSGIMRSNSSVLRKDKFNEEVGNTDFIATRSGLAYINYQLTSLKFNINSVAHQSAVRGSFNVRVRDGHHYPASSSARTLTNALYQALLLRTPEGVDIQASEGYVNLIRRNGYRGLVESAEEIAKSYESRRLTMDKVYSKYPHLSLEEALDRRIEMGLRMATGSSYLNYQELNTLSRYLSSCLRGHESSCKAFGRAIISLESFRDEYRSELSYLH